MSCDQCSWLRIAAVAVWTELDSSLRTPLGHMRIAVLRVCVCVCGNVPMLLWNCIWEQRKSVIIVYSRRNALIKRRKIIEWHVFFSSLAQNHNFCMAFGESESLSASETDDVKQHVFLEHIPWRRWLKTLLKKILVGFLIGYYYRGCS